MQRFGVDAIPHIPDLGDAALWQTFDASYQPWWAIIRTDGTWESAGGSIPAAIVAEAVSS